MRLFVAVVPPDDLLDAVAALDRPSRPGVRWTHRGQWHVTLCFLGEVADPAPVAAAIDAAALPTGGAAPVAVVGPEVAALGRHVVCLPVAGLDALAAAVTDAVAGFRQGPDPRPFRGHVTLARVSGNRARMGDLVGAPLHGRFPVTAVRLVRSRPGGDGPRYDDVHVRPLT